MRALPIALLVVAAASIGIVCFVLWSGDRDPVQEPVAEESAGPDRPDRSDRVTIRIVTEPFAPYMGPDLVDQGFLVALARQVLARAGYRSSIEFMPWARAVMLVREGRADVLLGAYYTEERTEFLHYSGRLAVTWEVLFARRSLGIESFRNLEDLRPYSIGVVDGAAHSAEFDAATFLDKQKVPDRDLNIRKLLLGRIDLMAEPLDVTLHLIRTRHPDRIDDIVVLDPPLTANDLHAGFSRAVPTSAEVVAHFDEAFEAMLRDGAYDELLLAHSLEGSRIPGN